MRPPFVHCFLDGRFDCECGAEPIKDYRDVVRAYIRDYRGDAGAELDFFKTRRPRISRAALRPGAPMTPPPGWAAAPQRYSRGPACGSPRSPAPAAEREELVRRHRALEDVAAGQAEDALQIERRQHLAAEHRACEVRRVLVEDVEAAVGERRPACSSQVPLRASAYGRVLHEHRHQVLPGRRHRRVDDRRDRALETRGAPTAGRTWRRRRRARCSPDRGRRGSCRGAGAPASRPGQARKSGSSRQRDVDLQRGALVADASTAARKSGGSRPRVDQPQ